MEARQKTILLALLITLLPALVYFKAFTADFVYDDYAIIVNEKRIETLSGALQFFYQPYLLANPESEGYDAKVLYYYRPLPGVMHALEYQFFGENPLPYKIVHLALVSALSLVSFLVLAGLTGNRLLSFFAALLFNLNPCRAEIGYWIYSDTHVLVAIFSLLSLQAYAKGRHGLFFLCYALALLSQEAAVMIPFVLLAYRHFSPGTERGGRTVWGALAVAAIYMAIRHQIVGPQFGFSLGPVEFFNTAVVVAARYLKILFIPDGPLTVYRFIKGEFAGFTPAVVLSYVAVAALAVGIVCLYRKKYRYLFWILWALIFMLPAFNVGGLGKYLMAEKGWNLASLGVFVVLADAAGRLGRHVPHLGYLALVLFASYGAMQVVKRGDYWQDTLVYLQQAVRFDPGFSMLHDGLYQYHVYIKDLDGAEESLKDWSKNAPRHRLLRKRYGELYYLMGFKENSEAYYVKSIEYDPDRTESYNNLGSLHMARGDFDKAAAFFEKAMQVDAKNYAALFNMGLLKERRGACAEAVDFYRRAAQINPKLRPQVEMKVGLLQRSPGGCP